MLNEMPEWYVAAVELGQMGGGIPGIAKIGIGIEVLVRILDVVDQRILEELRLRRCARVGERRVRAFRLDQHFAKPAGWQRRGDVDLADAWPATRPDQSDARSAGDTGKAKDPLESVGNLAIPRRVVMAELDAELVQPGKWAERFGSAPEHGSGEES